MMQRINSLSLGLALLLSPVPAMAENAGLSAPLAAGALDPAALDAARRYFAMPSMQGLSAARHDPRAIAHRFEQNLPGGMMTEDQREVFVALITEEFASMKAEYDETTIRVLAHVYTAEELNALITFEETDLGRQIAEKRPIYSVLIKDATAGLRRDALTRVLERFTGVKMEPSQ